MGRRRPLTWDEYADIDRARPAVANAGLQAHELADQGESDPKGVAIGTMHRSKGLQYRAVAVIGVKTDVAAPELTRGGIRARFRT